MKNLLSSLTLDRPCDESLEWLRLALANEGLRLMRTFDLHDARLGVGECGCPNHGTEACNCQMIVVLVYGEAEHPATLILHGDDEQTWFTLVSNPVQPVDSAMRIAIEKTLRTGAGE